jgi:disulfide bond formation protein DsbB
MFNKIEKSFYLIILSISILTILSALYIEYILSIPVCKLCLYQRIPYIVSIIICFLGYFFSKNKIWIYILVVTFLSSIIISAYHVGIENGIFLEFSGCTNKNLNTIDKSELLENLSNFLPNCKDVNFRIFGSSLATINLILSIALTIITVTYLRNEKNK